jgi:hypothetical protein
MMDHPSEDILKRFAAGTASREESRAVVKHLVKGCAVCARKLRELIEPKAVPGSSYEGPLDRFNQDLIENLEGAIPPLRTLRGVPRGALPDPPDEDLSDKKR